jgi:ABC-type lipoprotein release transport system permease subunit
MPPVTGSRRRAVATAISVVGIALGTSVMVASLAVGRGVERSIERTVEATLGRADFRVSAFGGVVSDEMLVTIRSVLGVEVAAPALEHETTLVPDVDTAASGAPVTILGIDPVLDGQVHDLDVVAGSSLTRRDEAAAVITERLAADDGFGLGSDVIVATPGEPERFRVIGIAAGDGPLVGTGGRTVVLPIDAVSRMFGLDGVALVDLLVEDGIPLAGVRSELGEALAGEPHVLTSPSDLADSLRRSTTGFADTAAVVAAFGLVFGALLVFLALRLTAWETAEIGRQGRVRRAVVLGAIGSGVGAVLGTVLGALTPADVAPAAAGLGGMLVAIASAVLAAVGAAVWPAERVTRSPARRLAALVAGLGRLAEPVMPRSLRAEAGLARSALEREPAGTALTVGVLAVGLGLVVGLAMVGANAGHTVVEPSIAPVAGRLFRQIDALAVLAAVVTALGIVVAVVPRTRERAAQTVLLPSTGAATGVSRVILLEAAILGTASACFGSILGLLVGATAIVVGGGAVDPGVDLPWAAIGLAFALGFGLALAAAWYPARTAGRPPTSRTGRFG